MFILDLFLKKFQITKDQEVQNHRSGSQCSWSFWQCHNFDAYHENQPLQGLNEAL